MSIQVDEDDKEVGLVDRTRIAEEKLWMRASYVFI